MGRMAAIHRTGSHLGNGAELELEQLVPPNIDWDMALNPPPMALPVRTKFV